MIRRAPLRCAMNIQLLDILGVCGTPLNRRHDNVTEHFASRPRCTLASDTLRVRKFRHIKAMQIAPITEKISRIDMLWRLPMHITYTCLAHLIYLFLHPIALSSFLTSRCFFQVCVHVLCLCVANFFLFLFAYEPCKWLNYNTTMSPVRKIATKPKNTR